MNGFAIQRRSPLRGHGKLDEIEQRKEFQGVPRTPRHSRPSGGGGHEPARLPPRHGYLLATVLLLSVLFAPSISGQADTVTLQLKLTPGEALFHAESGTTQLTFDSTGGARQTSESRFESRDAIRALDVAALGAMWIEYAVEDYRITERGEQPRERLFPAVSFRVDPDGRVVERFADPAERLDFPFPLPGKPVRVGESWTRSATSASGEITVKGSGTYTLAGLTAGPDGRIARVAFTNEGRTSGGGTVLGLPAETRATTRVTGEYEWLLEKGRFGRYAQEFTLTSDIQVRLPGVLGLFRLSAKTTARGEPVPPAVAVTPCGRGGGQDLPAAAAAVNRLTAASTLPPRRR